MTVQSTEQITQAMKMVAAAKLAKAQSQAKFLSPYTQKLLTIVHRVVKDLTDGDPEQVVPHPYAKSRRLSKMLIVVVASDKGLCGAFNTNLFKQAMHYISAMGLPKQKIQIMPIGKKALEFFQRQDFSLNKQYHHLLQEAEPEQIDEAAREIIHGFMEEKYDAVRVIYTDLEGKSTQIVRTEPFLPLPAIPPPANLKKKRKYHYGYEPGKANILGALLPTFLSVNFYSYLLASQSAEHSARMLAMSKASDNARELLKELRLTYNRTRQASITKEILEIAAGAEAMSGGH